MKKVSMLLCGAYLLVGSALAGGSGGGDDAWRTFDTAAKLLTQRYVGPHMQALPDLLAQQRLSLKRRCVVIPQPCPVSEGVKALSAALVPLRDSHTVVTLVSEADNVPLIFGISSTGLQTAFLKTGLLVVQHVEPGSSAERSGIQVGDVIFRVDGQVPGPAQQEQLWNSWPLRDGFSVTLRHHGEERVIRLKTAQVRSEPSVTLTWKERTAIVRLPALNRVQAGEFLKVIQQAKEADAQSLLLDLRANEGGDVAAWLAVVTRLLGNSLDIQGINRAGQVAFDFRRDYPQGILTVLPEPWGLPIAVLVSPTTASAAEQVAYWLQQAGTPVFGTPTRGLLNTAATITELNAQVTLSISTLRWVTPGGQRLPERVSPTFQQEAFTADGQDHLLDTALDWLRDARNSVPVPKSLLVCRTF